MKADRYTWPQWVVFDLDGTLCDDAHRAPFAERKEWDAYHSRLGDDRPHWGVEATVRAFAARGFSIGIATGRPETYRKETVTWLHQYGIPFDDLQMRRAGDFRKAVEVKAEMFTNHWITLVLEDDARLVAMWRARGVPCFQVTE